MGRRRTSRFRSEPASLCRGRRQLHRHRTDSGATGPSIEERFSPADTPGLELDQFKYVNSTARAAFDWRSRLGYAGSGGLYRVQFDDFRENDNDQCSCRSLEAEVCR